MRRNQTITGVVLAGGRSRRFGDDPKATATLGNRPLVRRVVNTVRDTTRHPPIVAAGPPDKRAVVDDALSRTVCYTGDADWCSGPLAGLCGALDNVPTNTIFLCGCDMPLLSSRAISWLANRHATTEADATVPVDADGELQLLHGVYQTSALEEYCERRPDTDCLRSLLTKLSTDTIRPATTPDSLDLTRSAMNVNTKRELDAIDYFGGEKRDEG